MNRLAESIIVFWLSLLKNLQVLYEHYALWHDTVSDIIIFVMLRMICLSCNHIIYSISPESLIWGEFDDASALGRLFY